MIVLDTSALMAILLDERQADAIAEALERAGELMISAATLAEALIVARRRGLGDAMTALISGLGAVVLPVTPADAVRVADCYERWGKGVHPAGLNFGDCFAHALAEAAPCALLYVGEDFSLTDIQSALAA